MRPECAHHTSIPAYVRGRRRSCSPVYHPFRNFNSRPYARGDYTVEYIVGYIFDFNSRPCTRGDTPPATSCFCPAYFNSRPYARGDTSREPYKAVHLISIHAPTRGATGYANEPGALQAHFNSRPYARGDPLPLSASKRACNFNSRPYARGDQLRRKHLSVQLISIHAPTRGATAGKITICGLTAYFNSRPYARGDRIPNTGCGGRNYFNSRPYARGDGKRYAFKANLLFNPHKSSHSSRSVM